MRKRGEKQLAEYLEYYHLEKGYLLSFNFNKNKKIGLSIFSNLVIITVLNQLLKRILERGNPSCNRRYYDAADGWNPYDDEASGKI